MTTNTQNTLSSELSGLWFLPKEGEVIELNHEIWLTPARLIHSKFLNEGSVFVVTNIFETDIIKNPIRYKRFKIEIYSLTEKEKYYITIIEEDDFFWNTFKKI